MDMSVNQDSYPFSAIVGQEELKLALLLNAIDPRIGGALISGAKGTGKSTAVRALVDLLPEIEVVSGCKFNCSPTDPTNMCQSCNFRLRNEGVLPRERRKMRVVQLPLSITEDMLIGTLDAETALREGIKAVQSGVLGEANQNILYIDEINLLPDYLVNCFLDPASSGWNVIQREGVSLTHPSRFTLMASMNPEEGELRPQILDRFAFLVKTGTMDDLDQRLEIIQRNIAYEADPMGFRKKYEDEQERQRQRIIRARELLSKVHVPEYIFESVAKVCAELEVDGHRPDIVTIKAAKALAALNDRTVVQPEDVFTVSRFTLSHRTRRSGSEPPTGSQTIHDELRRAFQKLEAVKQFYGEEWPEMGPSTEEEVLERAKPFEIRRARLRQRKPLPRSISMLVMLLLMLAASYMLSVFLSVFFLVFSGRPLTDIAESLSFEKIWPLVVASMAMMLSLFLYQSIKSERRTVEPIVHFYEAKDGKLRRRIIQQHYLPKETSGLGDSRETLIPLYAFLDRLRGAIVGRGPKILESLQQLREVGERIDFPLSQKQDSKKRYLTGKHVKTVTTTHRGRYVWYELPKRRPWDIAFAPTIRASAPYQLKREHGNLMVRIEPQDIRVKVREMLTPFTILLLLDMSESMAASLDNVRDAVLSLHEIAYKKRDRVGLVIFKGSSVSTLQHPTTNLNLVVKKLFSVGASDFTPLAAGLVQAWKILRNEKLRNKEIIPILIIVSDGIANVPLERPLNPFTRSRFMNVAQADVIDSAYLLAREGVRTIVINPSHEVRESSFGVYQKTVAEKMNMQWLEPTSLLLEIPNITGGYYYGIDERGKVQTMILMDALTVFDRSHRPQ